jgi:hypothetical protein
LGSKFRTYMPKNLFNRFATRPSNMAAVGGRYPGRDTSGKCV